MQASDKIRIIATGGTIDKIYFDAKSEFQVGDPQVHTILDEANIDVPYLVQSLFRKDSLDLTDEDRQAIRAAVEQSPERLILITHGTDTMTETAKCLENIKDKTIIMTGSMEPARIRNSDAIFNVGAAVAAVHLLPPGVYLTMNGRIFRAGKVRKNRETRSFEPTVTDGIARFPFDSSGQ
ncbi:MAG: asparaginase domain-containing protein [Oligoflexus sp.]